MEITYTNYEGFYLPNLTLPKKKKCPLDAMAICGSSISRSIGGFCTSTC